MDEITQRNYQFIHRKQNRHTSNLFTHFEDKLIGRWIIMLVNHRHFFFLFFLLKFILEKDKWECWCVHPYIQLSITQNEIISKSNWMKKWWEKKFQKFDTIIYHSGWWLWWWSWKWIFLLSKFIRRDWAPDWKYLKKTRKFHRHRRF